jgi:glycosyltransferase involved in cell wall biosynthesis
MTMNAEVSVVIPVYNGAAFVQEAIQSALRESCVRQVLAVDDGSTDASLSVCRQVARTDERVTVLTHANGVNRGAGASRNLGLKHAACELVAFLDADDRYVPGRFDTALGIFASRPDIDGVYEPVEAFFETEEAEQEWFRRNPSRVTMVSKECAPEDLFAELLAEESSGHFHLNGLTVRRAVLDRVGLFDPGVRLVEDTEWSLRLASMCRLCRGRVDAPVAERRVHGHNTIMGALYTRRHEIRLAMWRTLLNWGIAQGLTHDALAHLADAYLRAAAVGGAGRGVPGRISTRIAAVIKVGWRFPWLIITKRFWIRVMRLCGVRSGRTTPMPPLGALQPPAGTERGLVSVIVPTWNRATLLQDALASVVVQDYRPIELIVVDDGSTDGTERLVRDWAGRVQSADFRVTFMAQQHAGAPAARNAGMRHARGEYVKFLDSDCRMHEEMLSRQIASLREHEAAFHYTQCAFVDAAGRVLHTSGGALSHDPLLNAVRSTFACPAVLWRASALTGIRWDEDLVCLQDRVFKAKVLLEHPAGQRDDEVLCRALIHDGPRISRHGCVSFIKGREEALCRLHGMIASRAGNRAACNNLSRERLSVSKAYLLAGQADAAAEALAQASRMARTVYLKLVLVRMMMSVVGSHRMCAIVDRFKQKDVRRKEAATR